MIIRPLRTENEAHDRVVVERIGQNIYDLDGITTGIQSDRFDHYRRRAAVGR